MGARETALNALIACRKQAAWSNGILKEYIRRDKLDRREAALEVFHPSASGSGKGAGPEAAQRT